MMTKYTTSTELYKQDISSMSKKISSDEERNLLIEAQKGNINARNKIIDNYLNLIVEIVNSIVKDQNADISDLIQEGNLALIKCIDDYSLSYHTTFYQYVYINVLRKVKSYFIGNNNCYSIPVSKIGLKEKIEAFKQEYQEMYGEMPSYDEIAEYIGFSEKEFKEFNKCPFDKVNIEDVQNNRIPFSDEIYDIEEEAAKKVSLESFIDWINRWIPSRNTQILLMKYGVRCSRPYTSKEISKIFNLSEAQVNYVIKRKLNQYYHLLNSKEHIKMLIK